MKFKAGMICVLAGVLAVPVIAQAGNRDKATGGGQILFSSKGAGNTIAFTAQGTAEAAKGQIQVIDRSGGNGRDQVKHHGEVTCIDVMGNVAKVAGTLRNGDTFNLYVEDTGEGQGNADVIYFDSMADTPECDFDNPDDEDLQALARGNAQVRDGDAQQARRKSMSFRKALNLAGLR